MSWGEPKGPVVPLALDEERVREIVREEFDTEMRRARRVMRSFAQDLRHPRYESLFPPDEETP